MNASDLNYAVIDEVKAQASEKEAIELSTKWNRFSGNIAKYNSSSFNTLESKIFAEHFFNCGYWAAKVNLKYQKLEVPMTTPDPQPLEKS